MDTNIASLQGQRKRAEANSSKRRFNIIKLGVVYETLYVKNYENAMDFVHLTSSKHDKKSSAFIPSFISPLKETHFSV